MSYISSNVAGIKCGNCSPYIDKALNLMSGGKAQANHVKGLVELEAIEDPGFDVVE